MKRIKIIKLKQAINHDDTRQYHYEAENRIGTIRFSSLEEEVDYLEKNLVLGFRAFLAS